MTNENKTKQLRQFVSSSGNVEYKELPNNMAEWRVGTGPDSHVGICEREKAKEMIKFLTNCNND